jgi:DHA3 family macrolide efflux protein-like MFS transporter
MGDHVYDLAVVWVAVQVAGSGVGPVVAASALTRLALGMLGGVLADRWDRRRAMIAADLLRAVTVGTLPVLAHAGRLQLWHLAAAAAVLAALDSLFNPALLASLPALAKDRTELQALNGLMDGTWRLALAVAPSMAGLLVALLPITQFFTLDAVSFLASVLAITALGRHLGQRPARV